MTRLRPHVPRSSDDPSTLSQRPESVILQLQTLAGNAAVTQAIAVARSGDPPLRRPRTPATPPLQRVITPNFEELPTPRKVIKDFFKVNATRPTLSGAHHPATNVPRPKSAKADITIETLTPSASWPKSPAADPQAAAVVVAGPPVKKAERGPHNEEVTSFSTIEQQLTKHKVRPKQFDAGHLIADMLVNRAVPYTATYKNMAPLLTELNNTPNLGSAEDWIRTRVEKYQALANKHAELTGTKAEIVRIPIETTLDYDGDFQVSADVAREVAKMQGVPGSGILSFPRRIPRRWVMVVERVVTNTPPKNATKKTHPPDGTPLGEPSKLSFFYRKYQTVAGGTKTRTYEGRQWVPEPKKEPPQVAAGSASTSASASSEIDTNRAHRSAIFTLLKDVRALGRGLPAMRDLVEAVLDQALDKANEAEAAGISATDAGIRYEAARQLLEALKKDITDALGGESGKPAATAGAGDPTAALAAVSEALGEAMDESLVVSMTQAEGSVQPQQSVEPVTNPPEPVVDQPPLKRQKTDPLILDSG